MVFNISTKANQPPCHIHSAKPTLKHHQYKHHQRHKSINVNPILTGCSDDHPVVRRASTCESHIHKSYTTRPKRVNLSASVPPCGCMVEEGHGHPHYGTGMIVVLVFECYKRMYVMKIEKMSFKRWKESITHVNWSKDKFSRL